MPSRVSKWLPQVSIVIVPVFGAVQRHQSDPPPAMFAWLGSSNSRVASTFEAVRVTGRVEFERSTASAKLSFGGAAACADAGPSTSRAAIAKAAPSDGLPKPRRAGLAGT